MSKEPFASENCPFCVIARGEDESREVIHAGHNWLAFFPLNPATIGHTLVIPRQHISNLWQVEPLLDCILMRAAIRVGRAIEVALKPEGMNLITSAGRAAEQTVFHLHLHVVPRWSNDGFGKIWPVGGRYEETNLHGIAEQIRVAYRGEG